MAHSEKEMRGIRNAAKVNSRHLDGELPIVPQKKPEPPVIAVIQLNQICQPGQFSVTDDEARWRSIGRYSQGCTDLAQLEPTSHTGSCRDRRLIQPTTMEPPTIPTNTRSCAVFARTRFRCQPAQSRVRAITVKIALEIKELHLQIGGRPEQGPVETFAANRPDQAFDEWMRQRCVRHRLDFFQVQDA